MPNRTGRARHLSVVPDIPDDSWQPTSRREVEDPTGGYGRASDIAVFVLVVTLQDVDPVVWRRIRVRSDLLLPELHGVLQTAMGWSDSHAHSFSVLVDGARRTYDMHEVLDDDGGSSEDHVRIDELLPAEGEWLEYRYDFGDGWVHTVGVENIDSDVDDLRSRCIDGEGACPPEDCGGPSGYREFVEHSDAWDPAAFDSGAVDHRLRASDTTRSVETESIAASAHIARLMRRVRPAVVPQLNDLLPRCELTIESSVDLPVAQTAMSKVEWFLQRVGDRGLELTTAGYLPPPVVEAIRDELDWGIGWTGPSSRETDHHQATDLREAARTLGLVRVLKGRLVRTKAGSQLLGDHVGLWHHCAARLPVGRGKHEQDAGTLFLIALAASASAEQRDAMTAHTMAALGWEMDARIAGQRTVAFLDLIGAHGPMYYLGRTASESPSWSRRFARDALRTSADRL